MFKSASDKQNDISRTGSHATKPFGTGRVEVLPPSAQPHEAVFLSFLEQWEIIVGQSKALAEEANWINRQLKNTLPKEEYLRLIARKEILSEQVQALQSVSSEMKIILRDAAERSWSEVFVEMAKKILTRDQFHEVAISTRDLFGPDRRVPPAGRAEMSENRLDRLRLHQNRQEKRQRYEATKQEHEASKRGYGRNRALPSYYKGEPSA